MKRTAEWALDFAGDGGFEVGEQLLDVRHEDEALADELLVDELDPDLLRVVGEIDTHTAPTLAERLADIPAHAALGLDLTGTGGNSLTARG